MATEFWASVTTLEDAARMFSDFDLYMGRRFKMTKSNRLVFIRPSPAEAFVKAKTGSLAEACNLLDQWLATEERISKYRFDEGVRERIHQLLAEAAETG